MSAFRDDRDALRERVRDLEVALGKARRRGDRGDVQRRVEGLAERVARARSELDDDRKALAELSGALEQLASELRPAGAGAEDAPPAADAKPSSPSAHRARRIMLGAALLAVAIGTALVALSSDPRAAKPGGGVVRLAGWPNGVDPVASLSVVRQNVPSTAELAAIEVRYVGASGLVDFEGTSDYAPSIVYDYLESGPPPPRAPDVPGQPRPDLATVSHRVSVQRAGMATSIRPSSNLEPVPPPSCTVERLWSAARAAGAPSGAVAYLRYARRGPDPRWTFEIEGTSVSLVMADGSCDVVGGDVRKRP